MGPSEHRFSHNQVQTVNYGSVENTAPSQMRSRPQETACCRGRWGYLAYTSRGYMGVHSGDTSSF